MSLIHRSRGIVEFHGNLHDQVHQLGTIVSDRNRQSLGISSNQIYLSRGIFGNQIRLSRAILSNQIH